MTAATALRDALTQHRAPKAVKKKDYALFFSCLNILPEPFFSDCAFEADKADRACSD